jgi:hypothetical protein
MNDFNLCLAQDDMPGGDLCQPRIDLRSAGICSAWSWKKSYDWRIHVAEGPMLKF